MERLSGCHLTQRKKVTIMKKLQMLTAAAGILLALAGPSLAAQRVNRGADAYASATGSDWSGPYYYGPQNAQGRAVNAPLSSASPQFERGQSQPHAGGQNLPYADRPYGAPDSW
jgi:hypothetical protein